MLSAKQGGIKYYFLSLWYNSTGVYPGLPDHWRALYPLDQLNHLLSIVIIHYKNLYSCVKIVGIR